MLPRNGFFQNIQCPYNKANLCHRPYCHYRHSPSGLAEEKQISVSSSYLYNKDLTSNSRNQEQIGNCSTQGETDNGYVPSPVIKPAGILKAITYSDRASYSVPEYKPTPISKLRELNIPTGPDYDDYPPEYPSGSVRKKKNIEEYDPTEIKCISKKSVSFADETEGGLLTCESAFSSDDDFDDTSSAPKFSDDECEENGDSERSLPLPSQPKLASAPLQKVESEESDIDDKKVDEFSLVDKILIETKRNEKLLKFHKKDTTTPKPLPQSTKPSLILKGNDPKRNAAQKDKILNNNDIYNMDDNSQSSVPDYSAFDSLVPPIEIDSLIKSKYDKKTFDSEIASYNSPTQDEREKDLLENSNLKDNLDKDSVSESSKQSLKPKRSDLKIKGESVKSVNKLKDKKKELLKTQSSNSEKKHSKSSDDKKEKNAKKDGSKKILEKTKDSLKDSKSSKKSDSKINDSSKRTSESKNSSNKDSHKNKDSLKKSKETTTDSMKKEKPKAKESDKKNEEKIKLKISLNSNNGEKSLSREKTKNKIKQTDFDKDIYNCSISSSSGVELQDGKVSSSSVEKKNKSSANLKNSKSLSAPNESKSKHNEDSKLSKKPFKRKDFSDSESERTLSKNKQASKKFKSSFTNTDSSNEDTSCDDRVIHKKKPKLNLKNSQGERIEVITFSSSENDSDSAVNKSLKQKTTKHRNSPPPKKQVSSKINSIDVDIIISSDSDCDPNEECWKIYNETFNENSNDTANFQKEESAKVTTVRDAMELKKKRFAHAAATTIKKPKFSSNKIRPVVNPGQAMHNRYAQIMKMREENNELKIQAQPLITGGKTGIRIAVAPNSSLLAAINEKKKHSQGLTDFSPLPSTVSKTLKPSKRIAHVPEMVTKPRPIIPADYGSKVPTNIRQKFLNTFIDEFLKFTSNEEDAYEEALEEEKKAFQRSSSKAIYMNVASNTLARLRHRTAESSDAKKSDNVSSTTTKSTKKSVSHQTVLNGPMAQRTSFSIEKKKPPPVPDLKGTALYEYLLTFAMTGDQLRENGFPMAHPTETGRAVIDGIYANKSRYCNDQFKRTCIRCQKVYYVNVDGDYVRDEECDFHWGRLWKRRIAGAFESRYNCCQGDAESDGCCVSPGHVFEGSENHVLSGYVKTLPKTPPPDKYYGIYALDCEMCYTTAGMELTRVTVVGPDMKPVYETFVKPLNQVLDYNTRFSGITEDNLKNVRTTLRDVQAVLLCIFNSRTILIGHSLESDFKALKLIHPTVVDTSVVFPHKMGLPYKRALKTLMGEKLNKIIQNDVGGHDSQEDAVACMELMLFKVKEDLKNNR